MRVGLVPAIFLITYSRTTSLHVGVGPIRHAGAAAQVVVTHSVAVNIEATASMQSRAGARCGGRRRSLDALTRSRAGGVV